MTITDSELSAIEARAKAATGGQWDAEPSENVQFNASAPIFITHDAVNDAGSAAPVLAEIFRPVFPGSAEANAAFIARCGGDNGDVLRLVAEVRRLRAELEKRG